MFQLLQQAISFHKETVHQIMTEYIPIKPAEVTQDRVEVT
jgi:hypothetical protein